LDFVFRELIKIFLSNQNSTLFDALNKLKNSKIMHYKSLSYKLENEKNFLTDLFNSHKLKYCDVNYKADQILQITNIKEIVGLSEVTQIL